MLVKLRLWHWFVEPFLGVKWDVVAYIAGWVEIIYLMLMVANLAIAWQDRFPRTSRRENDTVCPRAGGGRKKEKKKENNTKKGVWSADDDSLVSRPVSGTG